MDINFLNNYKLALEPYIKEEVEHLYGAPCEKAVEVSVIVGTYNQDKYIEKCILSILKQKTNFNFEIIIGEDQSSDSTRSICIDLAKKYPDTIKLHLNRRANAIRIDDSPVGRINFLYNLVNSSGKHIALCDGDDYWISDTKLQEQYNILEANNDVNYVFGRHQILKGEEILHPSSKFDRLKPFMSLDEILKINIMPLNSALMFRTAALPNKMPSFFLESFNFDWCMLFLLNSSSRIAFINQDLSVYRQGVGVISQSRNSKKFINGYKTNKKLNKDLSYKYNYHLGKQEWLLENIVYGLLEEGKHTKSISYFVKKIIRSIKENNFKNIFLKNILFFKHCFKLLFKQK